MRLAAALLLLPLSTFAQSPTQPPEASRAAPAQWSLGAGWSPGYASVITTSGYTPWVSAILALPAVTASLERRLGERTWLALGVSGSLDRRHHEVPPYAVGASADDLSQIFVTAGVRQVVTAPGAPVDVSLLGLADGGVTEWNLTLVSGGVESPLKSTAWRVGVSIGLAIDRELTGGLSLRVASPLLYAAYARSHAEPAGQPTQEGESFSVAALIAPRLELRLAF